MEVKEGSPPKKRAQHLAPYQFKLGQKGNPRGRPKGSRNGISEAFLRDMLADWQASGVSAIEACRLKEPAAYLKIVASLVPKEFKLTNNGGTLDGFFEEFNDSQLDRLAGLLANFGDETACRVIEVEATS